MTDTNPDERDDEPDDSWMEPVDDEILELMQDPDVFEPSHIDDAGICRGPDAANRCRALAKHGLLERLAIGMYDITETGERYLEGEVDPDELEKTAFEDL
ncbi:hypothetical protein RBH26_16695 [Natronolimnohabitans sp. A-GB9]|uniref:hypothetical protein n=1 Tax=Natronolimnohabitans sp. A-GB9 TaxID=3069757 RepID=UPI0027B50C49|nr:hypothetical protein [Natronolimnohabitans sp. A-GB9]MDQ2052118.1 hypothetical protein [Natronolimnohabitans sp. A-GB9]